MQGLLQDLPVGFRLIAKTPIVAVGGEMSSRLSHHIIQISRYVSHVSILRLNFRIINNKAFAFLS